MDSVTTGYLWSFFGVYKSKTRWRHDRDKEASAQRKDGQTGDATVRLATATVETAPSS